jgi:VWFA-related protein
MQPIPMSRRQALLSAISLVPASRLLRAQNNQPPPKFSAGVKVVNVFATVRDKQGQIVRNLAKDDFTITEDSRPQSIRYFAQQSDLPLTVGLLIDTSMSERRMIPAERQASRTFFEQILRPDKDKAFLLHFDREVELLQDLTSSRERLEKALDLLDQAKWGQSGGGQTSGGSSGGGYGGRGGGGHGGTHGGTTLFDAVYLASNDVIGKQTGRKALLLLTDGEDNASKVSLDEAVRAAQRADALGYSIRIADEQEGRPGGFGGPGMGRHGGWGGGGGRGGGPYGRGPYSQHVDGKKILQQISKETGGGYFEVSRKKSVDQIYAQIEEELRNQYSLGYTSDRADTETGYRKIQVTVKRKGCTVQARDGYFAGA